jgi:hypothetical protein
MHIQSDSQKQTLADALWQSALATAGPVRISPACERSLRPWIVVGIQRMERQRRMAPKDLALAHRNLQKFVELLKQEAVFLGQPDRLDEATFQAARQRLRRRTAMTPFTLWPFWPHSFVLTS